MSVRSRTIALVAVALALAACNRFVEEAHPPLTGDYLGQTPPTDGAELFAPGLVNRGLPCRDLVVAPDGDEILWCEQIGNFERSVIYRARRVDGVWSAVETAPFSGDPAWKDFEPSFAPDGRRLFFVSNRPSERGGPVSETNAVWLCEAGPEDWGAPVRLPDHVNAGDTYYPSVDENGVLYVTRGMPDRRSAIFRCPPAGNGWGEAEMLPDNVNAGRDRFNAVIRPDGGALIVPIFGLENAVGGVDYYEVRREGDGWSAPRLLGPPLSSPSMREWALSFSPDGRYLFFMSDRPDTCLHVSGRLTPDKMRNLHLTPGTGQTGIWWMPVSALETHESQKIDEKS